MASCDNILVNFGRMENQQLCLVATPEIIRRDIMFKRIDHVEIVTPDMNRSISFYTDVLGFRVLERRKVELPDVDEIAFLQLNDSKLELLSAKSPASLSGVPWLTGYRSMAIEVEDMDKAVAYLKSKGVEITWGPRALGKSRRAEIKDWSGLSIEIRQW